MVTAPPPVRALPLHAPVLRRLRERGVSLELAPGETPDLFQARIETALMALFRETRGEAEFQALYEYARGGLLAWILGQLRDPARAPDPLEFLQDTFVNVYRYADGFREQHAKSFRVWSRTIATNVVRRRYGRGRGRPSLQALPEGLQEPVDPAGGPDRAAESAEEQGSLCRAWVIVLLQYAAAYRKLAARDRRALELVEIDGLSYAEAGRELQVGLSNMKMIMFRSRRRLRGHMGVALAAAGALEPAPRAAAPERALARAAG